jgi:S1-C subfamily serine protease
MSGNAKFRWFLLAQFIVALLVVTPPNIPAQDIAGDTVKAYKNQILLNPNNIDAYISLGNSYEKLGQYQNVIEIYTQAIRVDPYNIGLHILLGNYYKRMGRSDEAMASYKEAIKIDRYNNVAQYELRILEKKIAEEKLTQQHIAVGEKLDTSQNIQGNNELARQIQLLEKERAGLREERNKLDALRLSEKNRRLEEERGKLAGERKKLEALRLAEEKRQQQAMAEREPPSQPEKKQKPQSGTGSGFFVSKMGHVITNAHVVQSCKKVTIGDSTNKQITAEIINTDRSNDLALLKLSSLEMASAESKALIQKLSIVVVPTASTGLLRSGDVRLGEKVLVAGYPFGNTFSNTIKVTTGVVSATRGAGDNSGQFQLDAAVQPGNSGGPIYDSSGNIVGVVISQLNKKTFGGLVENVNFGIKASTVRQFLVSSGLSSKKADQVEEKSTEQLAEIAKNQALMVMCFQ